MLQVEIAILKDQIPSAEQPLAKIQTFKKKNKTPAASITIPPQTVQLQGENTTLKLENIELKAKVISLDNEKNQWLSEKEKMQKEIEELKAREFPEPKSPTSQLVQDMSDISLKDMEITQLKEKN